MVSETKVDRPREEAKYIELPQAEKGKVVVRFPPEASGYLHIGHAKAALLNYHYKVIYDGKFIFRFDDTNPEKEKEDFEDVIREDISLLEIKPDICSYTSDYFDIILKYCEILLNKGIAYVDDTSPEQMKTEREQRIPSKNRDNPIEKNLKAWKEMIDGTDYGQTCCVRVKIDMCSDNGCLRDPTIYRCKKEKHPRTGEKYNVYPTYDFACPIVDSIEGVTHSLRTTEYTDRDAQFNWFLDKLGLRKPYIYSFSRLNMMNTVLSKRKLTWFVEQKIVKGWDDPRMPTVRGILRRGLSVEGLRQFIIAQGSSRSVVFMEWDKIWSFNRKVIDTYSPRFMAIEDENHVTLNVDSAQGTILIDRHPTCKKHAGQNQKISSTLFIDQADAQLIKEGDKITLMKWGNSIVEKVIKDKSGIVISIDAKLALDDKDFKKTQKISWISSDDVIKAKFRYYENIICKQLGKDDDFKDFVNRNSLMEVDYLVEESAVKQMKKSFTVQFLRRGYFILDEEYNTSTVPNTCLFKSPIFISIPDGSSDLNIFPIKVQNWKKSFLTQDKSKHPKKFEKVEIKEDMNNIPKVNIEKADNKLIVPTVSIPISGDNKSLNENDSKFLSFENSSLAIKLDKGIRSVGENVRKMKMAKETTFLKSNIDLLLYLKSRYKEITGKDWIPPKHESSKEAKTFDNKDTTVHTSKEAIKKSPEPVKVNVNKNQLTSKDIQIKNLSKEAKIIEKLEVTKINEKAKDSVKEVKNKKQTRLGIEIKKSENFSDWYIEVITKAEMIEYYDVSGCYILRPVAFSIWELIQAHFDRNIKQLGVKNCYFPMFVSASALEKEKNHIADFAPEVAWVTKSGSTDLFEHIAIRPTSETVMYPSYAKWIKSHRDLPIKLNQWCNVVRWEFKSPTPFLRTREFLWQEGHTAYANRNDAVDEVYKILDLYADVYENLLAIPVIKGRKTEKEKFAGGDFTTTIEAYVSANGRGIQAATSHHLGQNFSNMFQIEYEDPNEPGKFKRVFQNSWGLSTRSIGCMVMIHSDDKGLVLPPRVASIQVIIVPCGITATTTEEHKNNLLEKCKALKDTLIKEEVKCECDLSDHYSPGWKFNHWELKGVPIRIEIGPKDLANNSFVGVRRDTGDKKIYKQDDLVIEMKKLLITIHNDLFEKAKKDRDDHLDVVCDWSKFIDRLNEKFIIMSPFCEDSNCEEIIKKNTSVTDSSVGLLMGAKTLCIPFEQPRKISDDLKCINPNCLRKPKSFTLFGRSY